LIIFFATTGIVSIGLVIGSIATLVLDRGAKKMFARRTVNARTKKLRKASTIGPDDEPSNKSSIEHPHHIHLANERAEFTLMREVQDDVRTSQTWNMFIISTVAIAMLWFFGAAVFWSTEKASQSWS
jgi:potassium channel subfamily K